MADNVLKVGGKTGSKIVKNVIKHGGDELKNQTIQTNDDVVNTVKKLEINEAKITPNEDVQEIVGNQKYPKSQRDKQCGN